MPWNVLPPPGALQAPLSQNKLSEQVSSPDSFPPREPRAERAARREHPLGKHSSDRRDTAGTCSRGTHPGSPQRGVPGAAGLSRTLPLPRLDQLGSQNPSPSALSCPPLPALAPRPQEKVKNKFLSCTEENKARKSREWERGAAAPWQGWEAGSKPCGQRSGAGAGSSHHSPGPAPQTALKLLLQENWGQFCPKYSTSQSFIISYFAKPQANPTILVATTKAGAAVALGPPSAPIPTSPGATTQQRAQCLPVTLADGAQRVLVIASLMPVIN